VGRGSKNFATTQHHRRFGSARPGRRAVSLTVVVLRPAYPQGLSVEFVGGLSRVPYAALAVRIARQGTPEWGRRCLTASFPSSGCQGELIVRFDGTDPPPIFQVPF
jgi:hypothetical protein